MGAINIDNSGSGSAVILKSDGTSLLLNGTALGSGGGSSATKTIANKTAAYTVVAGDLGKIINCTSGAFTVSLTAAATLGAGFTCTIWNTSDNNLDVITIDPNASETIDGMTTLIVNRAEGIDIVCDGTNWQLGYKRGMRGYNENYLTVYQRNVASGVNALTIGRAHTASGSDSFAIGAYGCTASNYATFAAGVNCTASGYASTAIGNNSTGYGGAVATTGAGAMALGGSYASGIDSFAAGIGSNTSTYGAQYVNAVALGFNAKAASYSFATGYQANASANYTFAIGTYAVASAADAVAIGWGATANGTDAIAIGFYPLSTEKGKYSFSSGRFAATGDAQFGKIVLRAATTTTTAVILTSDAAAATTTNQLIVASNQAMTFFGTLIAKQSASANMASYLIKGSIVNNAGTVSISSIAIETIVDTIGLTTQPTFTADNTNKALTVTSGAKATTNIRWVCNLDSVEVTYA